MIAVYPKTGINKTVRHLPEGHFLHTLSPTGPSVHALQITVQAVWKDRAPKSCGSKPALVIPIVPRQQGKK